MRVRSPPRAPGLSYCEQVVAVMQAIHQLVAGFTVGDAISNEALALQNMFKSWGYTSEVFCEKRKVNGAIRCMVKDVSEILPNISEEDIIVLHLSIGAFVNELFTNLPCKKVVRFHNITPPPFFRGINEVVAAQSELGYKQLDLIANCAMKAIAVSSFNAAELKKRGYTNVDVIPLLVEDKILFPDPDADILQQLNKDGYYNVIFVGRGAPNKRIEDLLCFFHYLQLGYEGKFRFFHIGSYIGFERYQMYIEAMSKRLGLKNCVFTGPVTQNELAAYYKTAHLFLSMSEHEGFCVPLLESMAYQVPVMAYASSAIPDTLNGAGVLFFEKNWQVLAEMAYIIMKDEHMRSSIIQLQNKRWQDYKAIPIEQLWRKALQSFM